MTKMLKTLLLAIGMVGLGGVANAEPWKVKDMNQLVDSSNFIVGNNCSGTLISLKYRLILTNHHCVTDYFTFVDRERVVDGVVKKVRVEEKRDAQVSQKSYSNYRMVGSATWQSQLVARWKQSDLALLQIRAKIPHKLQTDVFAGKSVMRGETVYAVGNPMMLDATISKGIISSVNRMMRVRWADNKEVPFIQMTAPIAGGSSGGALYNEDGQMIGVPAASGGRGNVGLAIPFFRIQEFLTKNCYKDVWDKTAETFDVCTAKKKALKKSSKSGSSSSMESSSMGGTSTSFELIMATPEAVAKRDQELLDEALKRAAKKKAVTDAKKKM